MATVTKTTSVVLDGAEVGRALVEYAAKINAGELPEMNPENIMVHISSHDGNVIRVNVGAGFEARLTSNGAD